jgi:ribonuclease-3
MDNDWTDAAESITGYKFTDPALLEQALSHSSAVDDRSESNERLEFLGDSVLGFVVCCVTYERFPDFEEGDMTKVKSLVVSRKTCSEIADSLEIARVLRVGKGMNSQNEIPNSVTGAAFEALIGAIYLDGGLEKAKIFVLQTMSERIDEAASSTHQDNYKSILQQFGQKREGTAPLYVVLDEKGPDHAKCFEVAVDLNGRRFESCWAASKKQAEQLAALAALLELEVAIKLDDGSVEIKENYGE